MGTFTPDRLVESMVRTFGGGDLVLRFKAEPLISGAGNDPRLGLSADTAEEVTVSPVLCRELQDGSYEYTVPSRVLEQHPELMQRGEADVLLESALGIVRDDKLLRIVSVSADMLAGSPYVYRITAQE